MTQPEVAAESTADGSVAQQAAQEEADTAAESVAAAADTTPRTVVRITEDVGPIYGIDEREYDLSSEDVVTLPATNADPLIERDAAEVLD